MGISSKSHPPFVTLENLAAWDACHAPPPLFASLAKRLTKWTMGRRPPVLCRKLTNTTVLLFLATIGAAGSSLLQVPERPRPNSTSSKIDTPLQRFFLGLYHIFMI